MAAGEEKLGYEKIRFCGDQAERDGLQYFWVDTCCINKANTLELSQAINSMFRWYRKAARCYVYLSDVSSRHSVTTDDFNQQAWDSDFWNSRWFTRGWTLQELLAPRCVEFFSCERKRLGDKKSLMQQIHKITGIPELALQGASVYQFSVEDRLFWVEPRQTKLPEDKVYSLLGIFDVKIPLLYGEGVTDALKRLREVIDKREKCIRDLRITDPRDDMNRIEDSKGGLLKDSYRWILENSDFRKWSTTQQSSRLLWIKGDPGKGKIMLLCSIINELSKSNDETALLSYFFCQAADSRINHATAVLRGLIYMVVRHQPSLVAHIQKKYDHAGKAFFEDVNAWVALSEIFTNILQDPSFNTTYLIIDALDECLVDRPKLVDFVMKSARSPRVKWIVSSRNWPSIEKHLDAAMQKETLCLELNEKSVSAAVATYIQFKVAWLAKRNKYGTDTQDAVQRYLSLNAHGTFLWVALVCQELVTISGWKVQKKLTTFPPGLDAVYRRMLDHICNSDDAELCKRILAVITVVHRPVTMEELASFVDMPDGVSSDYEAQSEVIGLCGSFLTFQERTISWVHQSAKDFLVKKAYNMVSPSGIEYVHHSIFSRSLQVLSQNLRRDVYGLHAPGFPIDEVKQPDPDPLSSVRYSCVYWIDHLLDCDPTRNATNDLQERGSVDRFLRQSYLYWLEALSLCRSMSEGVLVIAKLEALLHARTDTSALIELVRDAWRFVMYHKLAIKNTPLQVYASALLFSPARSLIRGLFKYEELKYITIKPPIRDEWSACIQTLEGHSDSVSLIAFSPDSARLASASWDRTVKIWDVSSGKCLQTLKFNKELVSSIAFSPDSARLASASWDWTVKIWDVSSGECLQTLNGYSGWFRIVAFSYNLAWVASAWEDCTVKIWDMSSCKCLQTLKGHSGYITSLIFSHDSALLVSASEDWTFKIWNISSGECLQTLESQSGHVRSVAFSHDSTRLAAVGESVVEIWDASSGECLQTLKGHSKHISSVAFSHDSARLASASGDRTVKIWDASSGKCLQTLEVGIPLENLSFHSTGSFLHTDIGVIALRATPSSSSSNLTTDVADPRFAQYHGWAISPDKEWITYNSKNWVWLPSEYRPLHSAVSGKAIGVGVGSGKVWIFSFKERLDMNSVRVDLSVRTFMFDCFQLADALQ